ncbi:MAG: polyhydroxyalkanoate depolymerase [Porticoccus sp.]|nr:polyhydroxyalkanoate depolymerase [Porticoccus sp.]MBQ0807925.1 polyhydroxyalkanoate depolymerase [Porticoccus sp.]
MQYHLYDLYRQSLVPVNTTLDIVHDIVTHEKFPFSKTRYGRFRKAALESTIRLIKHYPKQGFEYPPVTVDGIECPISEEVVMEKPFCHLVRFRREGLPEDAPKLLCVAALSGHHATLARETFREFLPDYEVYVTDWKDARDVPLDAGKFGYEEYTSYLVDFMEHLGPNNHVFAICQAAVPALTAACHMAKKDNICRPKTLTMMAGPIDIRVNPNEFSKKVLKISAKALERVAIHKVPRRYEGAGRLVYPGTMQLGGFMSMNMKSHMDKHVQFFKDILRGNADDADKHRDFYDEYMAVLDMDADFYLETMDRIFLDQHLPKGLMKHQGETINCSDITDIAILTLEGENDDMISLGQTEAALHLCDNLPKKLKKHYVQKGVGHYGIFNGSKYRKDVAPKIKDWINKHHEQAALTAD